MPSVSVVVTVKVGVVSLLGLVVLVVMVLGVVGAVSSMPVICAEPKYLSAKFVFVTLKQRYLVLSDSLVTVTVPVFEERVTVVPPVP